MKINPVPTATSRTAETDRDLLRVFPGLRELRPQLTPEHFIATIRRLQGEGYVLVLLEAGGEVAAIAGYRFSESLARGRFLYVDDLVTCSTARRAGHGKKLFAWLVALAENSGCQELHLDSGIQRTGAHIFYEKQKMVFSSRHYSRKLKAPC